MPSFDSLLPSDRSADPASIVGRLADAADGEASPPLTIGAPADAEQVPDSIRDDTFDGFESEVSDRLPLSHPIPGTFINGNALLRTKEPRTTRRGSPYWNLTLGNAEGTIVGKVWTQHYADWTSIAIGAPVWVSGEVKEGWQGGPPELHVRFVEPLPSGHAVSLELNLASPIPLSRLIARWEALLDAMMVPGQALVLAAMRAIGWDLFIEAPGAAAHHHAYIHGLLEHSVEVAEMAVELGRISPAREGISWDAVIAGALCHDIGKVTEYVWRGLPIAVDRRTLATTYHTASGQLVLEHAWHADRTLLEAAGVTLELVRHTQHVIESHHFTKEHGSLTPPSSVEAALVSAADEASARVSARWTDAISSPCDDEHWVDPIGYRKTPVWRPVGSISVSSATERGTGDNAQLDPTLIVVERWARLVATTSARAASAVEAGEGECGVSIIPTSDDDPDDVAMSGSSAETQTHAPALHTNEFSRRRPLTMRAMEYTDAERDVYLATYVCWLVRRDLEHWDSRRTLSREDAEWMVQQLEAELPPRSLERLQRLLAAA